MIPLLLAPLLSKLAESGMGLLAKAIETKGKDAIEKAIGIKIPDKAADLTPEALSVLKAAEMENEQVLRTLAVREIELNLEAEKTASIQVTERWKSDMLSDSWLSKNIRPLTLIFILGIYTIFSIASAFGISITESYVELLGQWGMLVMSAYFVGRSVEKVVGGKK
jgi:hypothetical protein